MALLLIFKEKVYFFPVGGSNSMLFVRQIFIICPPKNTVKLRYNEQLGTDQIRSL